MSAKVVPVKMPGFDSRKADAFVTGGAADATEHAPVRTKRFTIDVPLDLHARVKIACARRGLNMADELRRILEQEFPAE
ncbi:hypothetical protein GJ689_21595 [Rhodoplanes serenus]|uniref:Chromosome partitioning protein ParB n=1 Tax=Rhodoplanes serenus TaxID=200615 RepID=A0A327KAR4_9BRAD|nr:hypothetical protein [Rhodoplanes serenus]MTW18799.1 hypothetical protein [Rhodoplanes serenus]RAI35879.1 hypothetical protein CH340_04595 [Rhodoplanes serenus]